jgi:hypothetical protein
MDRERILKFANYAWKKDTPEAIAYAITKAVNEALEEAAKPFDGCSCSLPCDDYHGYVGVRCPKGHAAAIRALKLRE